MSRKPRIDKTSTHGKFRLTRRRKATVAATAAIIVMTPALAAAVIDRPPQPPLEVVVFPQRDFVVTEGGPAGQALRFEILRNGVVIGTSSSNQVTPSLTTDADGLLEVNHPGGLCWSGVTPNILPGDVLRVTELANPANGYEVQTQDLFAESAQIEGTDVVVRGEAFLPNGQPLPLGRMEQRIINPDFREGATPLERRDIRATTDDNNLVRDNSPGASAGAFIATHSGLNATNRQKALDGQDRVLGWMQTAANGDRMGLTIWEEGEVGGPGFGGCPAQNDYAVTAFNRKSIKIGTTSLTVSGTANDATAVRVTLRDGVAATTDPSSVANLSAGAVKTFRASFTGAQLRRLRDGRIRAVGSYTVGGTAISGVIKGITKDLVRPKPAQSDTRSGVYRLAQSVALSRAPGEARTSRIFYTTNGRAPGLGSLRFVRPFRVASTKTIRAVVIDQAGNKSVSKCSAPKRACWRIAIR